MLNELERDVLDRWRRRDSTDPAAPLAGTDDWLRFGMVFLLDTGRRLRAMRFAPWGGSVEFKDDGSPAIPEELAIEARLRQQLAQLAPGARVVGEESGGSLHPHSLSVAIDPIDGTWAMVSRSATHATTLAVLDGERLLLGMVGNAACGEIAYAAPGRGARLLQLACYGDGDRACDLPLDQPPDPRILVNLHPSPRSDQLLSGLHRSWARGELGMLKSIGGSPAWGLLEAAKGSFIYVNCWANGIPQPYDLSGSVLLLRQAGGQVVDLDGAAIDPFSHRGPFVAGIDREAVATVVELCRRSQAVEKASGAGLPPRSPE